jgi:hypothetical protein
MIELLDQVRPRASDSASLVMSKNVTSTRDRIGGALGKNAHEIVAVRVRRHRTLDRLAALQHGADLAPQSPFSGG